MSGFTFLLLIMRSLTDLFRCPASAVPLIASVAGPPDLIGMLPPLGLAGTAALARLAAGAPK